MDYHQSDFWLMFDWFKNKIPTHWSYSSKPANEWHRCPASFFTPGWHAYISLLEHSWTNRSGGAVIRGVYTRMTADSALTALWNKRFLLLSALCWLLLQVQTLKFGACILSLAHHFRIHQENIYRQPIVVCSSCFTRLFHRKIHLAWRN